MNFGIIGCGGIADRRTIPGMLESDRVKVVAVEDISEELTQMVAKKYGGG
jgi:predicted dehydrogenase